MERKAVFLSFLVFLVFAFSVFAVDLEVLGDTEILIKVTECSGLSLLSVINSNSELVSLEQGLFAWGSLYQTSSDPASGKYTALIKCADGTSQSKNFCVNEPGCLDEGSSDVDESDIPKLEVPDYDVPESDEDLDAEDSGNNIPVEEMLDVIHNISIEDNQFAPDNLTIVEGGEVVWLNYDEIPHKIVLDDDESELLFFNDSYSITFSDKGVYDYHCGVHPAENGSITVLKNKEPEVFEVEIEDFEFNPPLINLVVGDSVKWINLDNDIPHQIKGDIFNVSEVLLEDDVFSYQYKEEGNFSYSCAIHPEMIGMVSVLSLEGYFSQKNAPKVVVPVCTANVTCSTWSPCNGTLQQSKSCVDTNGCVANSTEIKECKNCTESWVCTDWSSCSLGKESRTCADEHSCSTFKLKPDVDRTCTEPAVSYFDEDSIETKTVPGDFGVEDEFSDFESFQKKSNDLPVSSKITWDDYKIPVIIGFSLVLLIIIVLLLYLLIIKPKKVARSQIGDYIQKQRRKGFSNKKIHDLLTETGWSEKDIEKGMRRS